MIYTRSKKAKEPAAAGQRIVERYIGGLQAGISYVSPQKVYVVGIYENRM